MFFFLFNFLTFGVGNGNVILGPHNYIVRNDTLKYTSDSLSPTEAGIMFVSDYVPKLVSCLQIKQEYIAYTLPRYPPNPTQ